MKNIIRNLSLSLGLLFSAIIYGQHIEVEFDITGDNIDSIYDITDFDLTLGVDASLGPEGLGPQLDNFDLPGAPPSLFVAVEGSARKSRVFFSGNETLLIEEFKPMNNSLLWRLQLEFGDPAADGLKTKIILNWEDKTTPGTSQFNKFDSSTPYVFGEIRDGTTTVIVKTNDTAVTPALNHTFEGDAGEIREVLIVLREDNIAPVAVDDSFAILKNDSKFFDVIDNDIDPDGDTLTIISVDTPSNGTASIGVDPEDGKQKIQYESSSDDETISFNYTVQDPSGATDQGTLSITIDDVIATRSHPDLALTGTSGDAGLDVTVTIEFDPALGEDIILSETMPRFDTALGFWFIRNGSGPNGLAISDPTTDSSGILPDLVEEVGDVVINSNDDKINGTTSDVVKFTWNTPSSSPIVFQYKMVSNDISPADRSPKTISGVINHGTNTDGPTVAGKSTFLPTTDFIHPADIDSNNRISNLEKNIFFAIPTAIVKVGFQRCGNESAGYPYTFEGNQFKPCPDIGADCSECGSTQIHPADLDQNQKLSNLEKNIFFAIPTAIVKVGFQSCGNLSIGYPYLFNGNNFEPDSSVPCNP